MHQLRVKLETVTPLFMGGAKSRGSPEIRAPSVRGALRYWLRAALGSRQQEELKQAEAHVFGDTEGSSAVTVRVQSAAQETPLPMTSTGLKYLFFSLKGDQQQPARTCFGAGNEVDLQMLSRPNHDDTWLNACASLWLLSRLGGLGARARRGAGALQPKENGELADWPAALPPLTIQAETPAALMADLVADLARLRLALGVSGPVPAPTEFDILAPGACEMWVLDPGKAWRSWSAALGAVGFALQKARSLPSRGQIKLVRAARDSGGSLPDIHRAGLGLPIVFHDVQTHENVGTLQGIAGDAAIERRASPLHIRVVKLNGAPPSYTVVLTWFNARFMPPEGRLALRDTPVTGDLPDSAWMASSFWPEFDRHSTADRLEVKFR